LSVKLVQVIICDEGHKGDGRNTVFRRTYQIWDTKGNLMFEIDPCDDQPGDDHPSVRTYNTGIWNRLMKCE